MKKTNKLFLTMCVAGSFALLLSSCKKEEVNEAFMFNIPSFEEEVDGRAYIDLANGNKFMWNAEDEIVVYNLDEAGVASEKAIYATTADAEGRQTAQFSYKSGDQISARQYGYFAFYPVSKVSDGALGAGNYETFTVADTQTYTLDPSGSTTVDPESMALAIDFVNPEDAIILKPIFGNLRLKLTGTGVVTKIEVIDNRYNLSGSVTMKLHEVKMSTFSILQDAFIGTNDPDNEVAFYGAWNEYKGILDYSANGTGKMMTLNCPEPVQLKTDEQTDFIIGLRPGALKYGFTLKVYLEGSNTPLEYVNGGVADWHYGIKAGINKRLVIDNVN